MTTERIDVLAVRRYTATFSDGKTITRKSAHGYTVAWRATWRDDAGEAHEVTGFAVSREKASPVRPIVALAYSGMSSANRAVVMRKNAEFIARSGYRVEFAEAASSAIRRRAALARFGETP